MYPSGYRTGHVSAMILSALITLFSAELIGQLKKKQIPTAIVASGIYIFAGIHYWQMFKLVSVNFEAFYSGFMF